MMLGHDIQVLSRFRPKVLDLFCGAGGMSLGFKQAGCDILGGLDSNPHAIRTHHRNFPQALFKLPTIDIAKVNFDLLGILPGQIDVLIGGPPCQVFSRVGIGKMKSLKKDIESDSRNFLYQHFVRALHYFRPPFFVMENVDALAEKPILGSILQRLKYGEDEQDSTYPGYYVKHKVLLASSYGVPQYRRRLFIVGVRSDLDVSYSFPLAHEGDIVCVKDAISDLLPLTPPYIPLRSKTTGKKQQDRRLPYYSAPQSAYQHLMRQVITASSNETGVMNHLCRSHNPVDMICFAMLRPKGKYMDLPESMRRYRWDIFDDKYKRLPWDEPAWTLTAHMRKDCLAYIHPIQTRSISVREAARLQSFPDEFVFDAPMTRMFELVGNSVPPLLAQAVAEPIVSLVHQMYEQGLQLSIV